LLHVFRVYFRNAVLRQDEKFLTLLRNELCSNNLHDLGLRKGLDHLDGVRQKFQATISRFAAFMQALNNGLLYLKSVAGAEMPTKVVAGVVGMNGRIVAVNGALLGGYGKMMTDAVEHTMVLRDDSIEAQDKCLLQLYEKIFDQSSHERPKGIGGFPRA
jgi:hypothetical protein